jgi:hypothetical protein
MFTSGLRLGLSDDQRQRIPAIDPALIVQWSDGQANL